MVPRFGLNRQCDFFSRKRLNVSKGSQFVFFLIFCNRMDVKNPNIHCTCCVLQHRRYQKERMIGTSNSRRFFLFFIVFIHGVMTFFLQKLYITSSGIREELRKKMSANGSYFLLPLQVHFV